MVIKKFKVLYSGFREVSKVESVEIHADTEQNVAAIAIAYAEEEYGCSLDIHIEEIGNTES